MGKAKMKLRIVQLAFIALFAYNMYFAVAGYVHLTSDNKSIADELQEQRAEATWASIIDFVK